MIPTLLAPKGAKTILVPTLAAPQYLPVPLAAVPVSEMVDQALVVVSKMAAWAPL